MPYPPPPRPAIPRPAIPPPRALRLVLLLLALLALLLAAFSAAGQLVPAGGPYRLGDGARVGSDSPLSFPRLLVHPAGGFLALWNTDGGVRGRRFGADGPFGAEIDFGPGVFHDVALAADGTLLFVDSAAVRRHALDGAALGTPKPYDDGYTVPWGQRRPYPENPYWPRAAVGADDDGGWIVVWVVRFSVHDPPWMDDVDELLMRRFDAWGAPIGPTTPVSGPDFSIEGPRLVADGAGGWLLTATSLHNLADDYYHGWRRLIRPGEVAVPLSGTRAAWDVHAACRPGGHSFTVYTETGWAWESEDGSCTGVFGLPADAGGDLGPQPVDLPRDTADCQWNARVAALGDGWVAGWQTGRPDIWWPGPDGNPFHGVSLRRFDLAGRPLGDPLDLRLGPAAGTQPYQDTTPLVADLAAAGDLAAVVWRLGGGVHVRLAAVVPDGPCRPGPGHLCLGGAGGDRFRVDAAFLNPHAGDAPGCGRAAPQTADTGAFWFFRPGNLELLVKVLDGRPVNRHHWVLAGAASSVEWWVTVTDTLTREQWGRAVPPHAFATLADVTALPRPPAAGEASAPAVRPPGLPGTAETVTLGDRYRLRVRWRDPRSGDEGVGYGVAVTADSALFWFFHPANLELLVKVLDGRPVNGHAWVLWASLTDVEYEIEIEDTATAYTWNRVNPPYHLGGGADTAALP